MDIYFTASTRNLKRDRKKYLDIIDILYKYKHKVVDSWLIEKLFEKKTNLTSQEVLLRNIQLLQDSDFALVELTTPSFGVGYFIGQALANSKKILCLYPENQNENEISEIVTGSTSAYLTYKSYRSDNLEEIIRDYVARHRIDELKKFNFIATEEILNFIEQGAENEGKSKSEFLRDKIVKELMEK